MFFARKIDAAFKMALPVMFLRAFPVERENRWSHDNC